MKNIKMKKTSTTNILAKIFKKTPEKKVKKKTKVKVVKKSIAPKAKVCLLYTSPSPRDRG